MNGISDSFISYFGIIAIDCHPYLFIYYNITYAYIRSVFTIMTFEYIILICLGLFVIFVSYKLGRHVRSVPENIFNKNISVVYLEEVGK